MSEHLNNIARLPEDLDLVAVFEAYSVLAPNGNDFEVVEALSAKYPRYAEDLVRFAAERELLFYSSEPSLTDEEAESELKASRATLAMYLAQHQPARQNHEAISSLAEVAKAKGFKKLNFARRMGLSLSLFVYLDKRRIDFKTIPQKLLERLTAELEVGYDALCAYLSQSPEISGNVSFKSQSRPEISDQRSFTEVIAEDQTLSVQEKRELLNLK